MEQLDQQTVNLTKAIRQSESGGNFQAKGKSGEYGAYQFTQPTWDAQSKKYGVNVPLDQATPEQQNEVAYKQIKEWKDSGKNVGQIASMWNAGQAEPDAYLGKFGTTTKTHNAGDASVGTNSYGAKYDVPAYAKSVATAYQTLKGGGNVGADPNNPSSTNSSTNKRQTFQEMIGNTVTPPTPTAPLAPGANQPIPSVTEALGKGDYLGAAGNAIRKFGSALTGGGSETMGNTLGTLGGYGYEKAKGLLGGKDNSASYDTSGPSLGQGLLGTAGVVGGIAAVAGAGKLATSLFTKSSALANPVVKEILGRSLNPGEALGSLTRDDAIRGLTNELSTLPLSETGGSAEQAILKALKQLNPTLIEKQSMLKTLAKGGFNLAKQAALFSVLGNTVGGLIHQNTNLK